VSFSHWPYIKYPFLVFGFCLSFIYKFGGYLCLITILFSHLILADCLQKMGKKKGNRQLVSLYEKNFIAASKEAPPADCTPHKGNIKGRRDMFVGLGKKVGVAVSSITRSYSYCYLWVLNKLSCRDSRRSAPSAGSKRKDNRCASLVRLAL